MVLVDVAACVYVLAIFDSDCEESELAGGSFPFPAFGDGVDGVAAFGFVLVDRGEFGHRGLLLEGWFTICLTGAGKPKFTAELFLGIFLGILDSGGVR